MHGVAAESITAVVEPYRTIFHRRKWKAKVYINGDHVQASGTYDVWYWPTFKARTPERALAKAEKWADKRRDDQTRQAEIRRQHREATRKVRL